MLQAVISLCHRFTFCRELIDSNTVFELAPNYKVIKMQILYQNDYKKDILIMTSSRVGLILVPRQRRERDLRIHSRSSVRSFVRVSYFSFFGTLKAFPDKSYKIKSRK